MKIFNRYIIRSVLTPTLFVLFLLVSLRALFAFIDVLDDVGKGEFTAMTGLTIVALSLPLWIVELLPMATLIGTVLGLGVLSSNSELTAMRAASVSPMRIGMATLRSALVLVFAGALISEFIVPRTSSMAEDVRLNAIAPDQLLHMRGTGVWMRSTQDYVFFRRVLPDDTAEQIYIMNFSTPLQLSRVTFAESARYEGDGRWLLSHGSQSDYDGEQVRTEKFELRTWNSDLAPDHLQLLQTKPEELSGAGLFSYRNYLLANGLDAGKYDLEFWRKVFQPLNLIAMVLAGIASVFGPLRTVTVSARILAGVAVGLAVHYSSQIFGPVSLVYNLPPILGALMPPLIFMIGAVILLRRAR